MERVITIATVAHVRGYKKMGKAFYSVDPSLVDG
jgi:hypothetical protein